MSLIDSPMPLSDIESVLAWVDTFKLSRPTKKINRDFSDAVLLAEILNVYYPKLVEMHNYPPRNSQSLKLNNWMTLNRKVLKKLKLNLCNNTMEQLANCAPGIIERVLVMVRDKIRRDEDLNKSLKEGEQNGSSGGSYYEACGEDDNILVVPVKVRVNGVLEVVQKKVVSHESYLGVKEELKDAKDSADLLKQKVDHLDNLLKLKEERIEELQRQLERKQAKRREVENLQNSLSVPFDEPPSPHINDIMPKPVKSAESLPKLPESLPKLPESLPKLPESLPKLSKEESRIPIAIIDLTKSVSKPSIHEVVSKECIEINGPQKSKLNLFKDVDNDINNNGFFDKNNDYLVNLDRIEKSASIVATIEKEAKDICENDADIYYVS